MEEEPFMKKMLSVLLAAMMLISLLAVPALAEDQVLTVVTWDAETIPVSKLSMWMSLPRIMP